MTLRQIAGELDMTEQRTGTMVGIISAPTVGTTETGAVLYESHTLAILREELAWQAAYDNLDEFLSTKSVGRHFGKNAEWVQRRTNELAIFPSKQLMPSKRYAFAYHKSVVPPLRHWVLHHPVADENLYTARDLAVKLGMHHEWVEARLEELGEVPVERVARANHILTFHYSQNAFEHLQHLLSELPGPAGDWLTVGTMAMVLERDRKWVLARVRSYQAIAELRLDDWRRPAVHYPPFVFDALIEENVRLREVERNP